MSVPPKSLVGTLIDGRYEVLERIASGGVGVVYRARRLKLERMVAIKVLHESLVREPGFVGRFQREAAAMSRLYHPHCVAVTDLGVLEGRPYLVLEYVPGKTLAQLLTEGRFEPARAINVTLQLLETLEYFHQHHIVHRDLKAENVMVVTSSNTKEFVKVLDFGMAKILDGRSGDSQLSKIGLVPGTPSAMAPEQIQQLPPDLRIDIYATGILLYEMVVGHRPFRGTDLAKVVAMQLQTPPTPPREVLGPGVLSNELEAAILKALEKDRFDRFGSAGEMAEALKRTPEGATLAAPAQSSASPVTASTPPMGAELPRPPELGPFTKRADATPAVRRARRVARVRRQRLSIAAGLGAVIVVVLAIVLWSSGGGRPFGEVVPPSKFTEMAESPASPVASSAPAPVAEPWLAHRDLAVTYAGRGQPSEAFKEVASALRDDPVKAAADPALVDAAVARLIMPDGAALTTMIVTAFRSNPRLVTALVEASDTAPPQGRRNAYGALTALGATDKVDVVAMKMLDVEQSTSCTAIKAAFKDLVKEAGPKDPRLKEFTSKLRAKGRKDPRVKCLRRYLRRAS